MDRKGVPEKVVFELKSWGAKVELCVIWGTPPKTVRGGNGSCNYPKAEEQGILHDCVEQEVCMA